MNQSEAGNRQSGRTTNQLKRVLDYAKSGKDCYYVVARNDMIGYCFAILKSIDSSLVKRGGVVSVPNGGSIRFVPEWSERVKKDGSFRIRGFDGLVEVDHFVSEVSK